MSTRIRVSLVLACSTLVVATPQVAAQATGESTATDVVAPSYALQMEGQSSEPWRWLVSGGADVAGVYGEEKSPAPDGNGEQIIEWELRMLAGPALDGVPMRIEDDWGILVPALSTPLENLESGEFMHTDLGPTAYDSVRWKLDRGDGDRTIDGRMGEHWVMTVDSWSRQKSGETVIPMETTARAELWFDPTLPFSLAPFAVARGSGFPLGVMDAAVSHHVLRESLPMLRERGLLLRAEISARQLRHIEGLDGPMTLGPEETTLEVSDVRPDGSSYEGLDDAKADLGSFVVLDAERAEALRISQYMIPACRIAAEASDASSGVGAVAGIPLEGRAAFAGGGDEALRIVVATPEEGTRNLACVVAVVPLGAEIGDYPATIPDMAGLRSRAPEPGFAWATVLTGDAETEARSIFVVEFGSVKIDAVATDRVTGRIALGGWLLSSPSNGPATLDEDARVDVSFVALPGG